MSRRSVVVLGVLLVAVGMVLGWFEISQFFAVDRCLDAGGSFNYTANACDFTTSHPAEVSLGEAGFRLLVSLGLVVGGVVVLVRKRDFDEGHAF
jgi:hypothetical protein